MLLNPSSLNILFQVFPYSLTNQQFYRASITFNEFTAKFNKGSTFFFIWPSLNEAFSKILNHLNKLQQR